MANRCFYDMVVIGDKKWLEKFEQMLNYKGGDVFYRVFSADVIQKFEGSIEVHGDCAWDFETSFGKPTHVETNDDGVLGRVCWNIFDWCKSHHCVFEAWAEESANGYCGHFALTDEGRKIKESFTFKYDGFQRIGDPENYWRFDYI